MNTSTTIARIPALDGIRIVLIVLIMLSHCEFLGATSQPFLSGFYNLILHNATLPVDFFFMLTGFGIMNAALQNDSSIAPEMFYGAPRFRVLYLSFAWKHIRKMYPVYLLGLLLSLPYSVHTMLPFHDGLTFPLAATGILFTGCLTLLQSLTGTMMLSHALNGVSWYLSSLFVILLFLPNALIPFAKDVTTSGKSASRTAKKYLLLCYVTILFLTLLFGAWETQKLFLFPLDDFIYGSPYLRFFYVLLGAGLAVLFHANAPTSGETMILPAKYPLFVYGFTLLWQFGLRNVTDLILGLPFIVRRTVDIPVAALLLFTLVSGSRSEHPDPVVRFFSRPGLCQCRNLSMILFLLHFPVRNYGILLFDLSGLPESAGASLFAAVSIFVVSFLLSGFISVIWKKTRPAMH